mgnify:CR=1 FL=1
MRRWVVMAVIVGLLIPAVGCNSTTTGAGVGAGTGAAAGYFIGGKGHRAEGAIIGGLAGAGIGALIGHEVGKVKYCPVCKREYQKEDYYCPYDGTELLNKGP